MARKSRRADAAMMYEWSAHSAGRLKTAVYARLSREKDSGCSIKTQISMLRKFVTEKPDLELADIYADNGATGTDFERPEFERMIHDVCSGRVQCIVVKDLSRFGRSLIDAGNYIENIFPKLGVRFIALTDDFDSDRREDRDSIAMPIKNMVNAMYAKDLSRKQAATFELHSRLGDRRIISAPYGYTLNAAENRLEPHPGTAPVVRVIFRWYLAGVGISEIVHRLNDLRVPSPGSYKNIRSEGLWNNTAVSRMLSNEVYIGSRILGKIRSAYYKGIPTHAAPREQWYIHENSHEPLISREDFGKAQDIGKENARVMAARRAGGVRKCTDRFRLKVKCRECGRTMMYFPNYRYGDAMTGYYRCYAAGKSGDTSTGCDVRMAGKVYKGSLKRDGTRRDCGKKVHEEYVRTLALDAIGRLFLTVEEMEGAVRELKGKNGKVAAIRQDAVACAVKLKTIRERIEGAYTDLADGILSVEEHRELREHYILEEHLLKEKIDSLGAEQRIMEKKIKSFLQWADSMSALRTNDRDSDKYLFDELIESIYIDDNKNAEFVFRCADMITEMEEILK